MATNSTQNETPAWVTPVALGLIILFFVVVLIFLAIRYVQPTLFYRIGPSC
jgi:hypothetical protein